MRRFIGVLAMCAVLTGCQSKDPGRSNPPPAADLTALQTLIEDADFAARGKVTGVVESGREKGTLTGSVEAAGASYAADFQLSVAGKRSTYGTTWWNGKAYEREDGGPWLATPYGRGVREAFTSLYNFRQAEIQDREGVTLYRVTTTGTHVPTGPFGLEDVSGPVNGTTEFRVRQDGTPVHVSIAASWKAGKDTPAGSMKIEWALSCAGKCDLTIGKPSPIFAERTSPRYGYTIALPEDWEVHLGKAEEWDRFLGADASGMFATSASTDGLSLNELTRNIVGYLSTNSGGGIRSYKVHSNVETSAAGQRARRVHATITFASNTTMVTQRIFVVKGGRLYQFDFHAPPGADFKFVDQSLPTIQLK